MSLSRLRRLLREELAQLRILFRKSDDAGAEEKRVAFEDVRRRLAEHARRMHEIGGDPEVRSAVGAARVAESERGNRLVAALTSELADQDPRSAEFHASLHLLRRNVELLFDEVEQPMLTDAERHLPDASVARLTERLRGSARTGEAAATSAPPGPCVSPRVHRRLRRITIALAVLIAIPLLILVALLIGLNPLVRKTTEKLATDALNLPVALEHARVNIAGGVHLQRLSVGNPRPFKEVRSFRLDQLDAAITLPSLFGRTIVIHELQISGPELIVEFDGDQTNWGAIFDNLAAASKKTRTPNERKFIIHRIRILHPVVVVRSKRVPKGVAIHLRDIELRDVGTGPGSASPTYLVLATIFQALLTGAVDQWSGAPGELGGTLGSDVSRGAKPFEGKLTPAEK